MYKRYNLSDIQNRVINLLQNNNPMSSTEISKKLGTNRITVSKYLDILYFQKILNKKKIGSVNFWFLEPGIINIDLGNETFVEIQQKLISSLINGEREIVENITLSLINKRFSLRKVMIQVYFPVLNSLYEMYNRGKIGKTEKIHLLNNLSESITLLKNYSLMNKSKSNKDSLFVIVSGDDESLPICNILDIYTKNLGINSTIIGNVENYLDPFFDIDFQRYLNKIFNKAKGTHSLYLISNNERSIKFIFSTLIGSELKEKTNFIIFSNKNVKESLEKSIQEHIVDNFENLLDKVDLEVKQHESKH